MIAVLQRPFGNHHASDPARYRAARRRSMRAALAAAAPLVVVISLLNAVQFEMGPSDATRVPILLGIVQATLAVAVIAAMRTRLRRFPTIIAFAFLLLVPIVPLATLEFQPANTILVSASLGIIPIAVALFIPWSGRVYGAWAASYLAVVAIPPAFGTLSSLSATDRLEVIGVVAIGLVFASFGQRRRDHADRLAFDRLATLRVLFRRSTDQQVDLARLNAELDRTVKREVRGRESMEAALARIDPGASPEAIAAAACAEIIRLPTIDSAWAISLCADEGRVLAEAGRSPGFGVGFSLPDAMVRRLLERAATGPWEEALEASPVPGRFGDEIAASGVVASIWSPLRGSNGIVGVIACASHDPISAKRLAELLPAVTAHGSIMGALVAPALEARQDAKAARDKIQTILDDRSSRPYFQPIVEFRTGTVVGYEALTRFADGTRPDHVFRLAAQTGLGTELEVATIRAAIEASSGLPSGAYLSLNASPDLLCGVELRTLTAGIERAIVIEITEHLAIDDYASLRLTIDALGPTVRLAVDDAGAGYASLRHILELAPDIVKLDIGLVRGIDADPARQALIAGIGVFAVKQDIRLVAEGIESVAELAILQSLGVDYGQGYLLGRPKDGHGSEPWPTRVDIQSLTGGAIVEDNPITRPDLMQAVAAQMPPPAS